MSISRTGACPIFLDYVTKKALVPRASNPTPEFLRLTQFSFDWIEIPSYQRGLVWNADKFEELLSSRSVFLGNAVLGAFRVPPGREGFERLPTGASEFQVLIDGLQRFSIGTALLSLLHGLVLADNPQRADDAPHFAALRANSINLAPVYQHNDRELRDHARRAVSDSYRDFRGLLSEWLLGELDSGHGAFVAERLQRFFLQRQIAPDTYHGFASHSEIATTFIGLNTVRVQLHLVDWLRSIIIDQGSLAGWAAADTESLENLYTEVFTRDPDSSPETELEPFVAIVKEALDDGSARAEAVFPSWNSGLAIEDVRQFLEFVLEVFDEETNPIFRELRACGAIPFAACVCHYYRRFRITGQRPSFLTGGDSENDELRAFLRANYRVLLDGRIGRTREFAERLLHEDVSLNEIADQISRRFLGHDLSQNVDRAWLVATLKKTDQNRAARVFNACLLPAQPGEVFEPMFFGKRAKTYQIDHLIAKSALEKNQPGEPEGKLLMNFAPIRRTANNSQSNLTCLAKLGPGGSYPGECDNDPDVHPFVRWLVDDQARHQSYLDDQAYLLPNANPAIGDERIGWIADRLIGRL